MRHALTILTRFPTPGLTKTRLASQSSNGAAATIHAAMLCDTVANFAHDMTVVICFPHYEPDDTSGKFYGLFARHRIPTSNVLTMQGMGKDMNGDIAYAHSEVINRFGRSVLMGSDMPHYQPDQYMDLMRSLDSHDVAYHPCEDDGCCPHGIKKPVDLWHNLNSRNDGYINSFETNCRSNKLSSHQLDPMYDVDTIEDVYRLMREHSSECPLTMQAIEQSLLPILHRQSA